MYLEFWQDYSLGIWAVLSDKSLLLGVLETDANQATVFAWFGFSIFETLQWYKIVSNQDQNSLELYVQWCCHCGLITFRSRLLIAIPKHRRWFASTQRLEVVVCQQMGKEYVVDLTKIQTMKHVVGLSSGRKKSLVKRLHCGWWFRRWRSSFWLFLFLLFCWRFLRIMRAVSRTPVIGSWN